VVDEYDSERFPGNFYQGMILKLDRARGRGVVRSHSGKEILFEFPFVAVVGSGIGGKMPGIDLIREGEIVGFDVGWTSRGLRVTTIYPRDRQGDPAPSESAGCIMTGDNFCCDVRKVSRRMSSEK